MQAVNQVENLDRARDEWQDENRLAELSEREQYAATELRRGTMTRHSLAACRSGTSRNGASFSFAGNRWSSFVPLRLPNKRERRRG